MAIESADRTETRAAAPRKRRRFVEITRVSVERARLAAGAPRRRADDNARRAARCYRRRDSACPPSRTPRRPRRERDAAACRRTAASGARGPDSAARAANRLVTFYCPGRRPRAPPGSPAESSRRRPRWSAR